MSFECSLGAQNFQNFDSMRNSRFLNHLGDMTLLYSALYFFWNNACVQLLQHYPLHKCLELPSWCWEPVESLYPVVENERPLSRFESAGMRPCSFLSSTRWVFCECIFRVMEHSDALGPLLSGTSSDKLGQKLPGNPKQGGVRKRGIRTVGLDLSTNTWDSHLLP